MIVASQMLFFGSKKMVISRSRAQRELHARGRVGQRVFVVAPGLIYENCSSLQFEAVFVKDI